MSIERTSGDETRTLTKRFRLSQTELRRIKERMNKTGINCFSTFIRRMALEGSITVDHRRIDVARVRHLLSPLGNNLNQIARHTNIEDIASHEEMYAALKILERCERILQKHVAEGLDNGRR